MAYPNDQVLITRFRKAIEGRSPYSIAEETGLPVKTVYRYLDPGYEPSRMTEAVRDMMQKVVDNAINGKARTGHDVSRETDTVSHVDMMPGRLSPSPEEQLVDMLGLPDALRRMAGHVPPSDLVAAAMQLAIDDGWSEERRDRLAKLCFEMLENAKKQGR